MFVEIGDLSDTQYLNLDNVTRISYIDRGPEYYMEVRFVGGTSAKISSLEAIEQVEDALGDTTFLRNRQPVT